MTQIQPKRSLATHYRRYAVGNVLIMIAGFVSFPITTRMLTSADFGVLGYWEAWIVLLTAVLKLGAGDTMMRFYPHQGDDRQHLRYATNFVLLPAALGLVGWCVTLLLVALGSLTGAVDTPAVAFAAMGIVLMQVLGSHVLWAMRTRELSGLGTLVDVAWRWLIVALVVGTLYFVAQSVLGLFLARLIAAVVIVACLLVWASRHMRVSWAAIDWPYAKEGFHYGLPLAFKELSSVVLAFVDRIMIKWLLDNYAMLGIYTIGISLANYVDQLVMSALGQAWTPAVNRLYTTQGPEAVREAKRRLFRPLVYVCVGLAVGIIMVGRDFVTLIAGAGKVEAANIFTIAAMGMLVTPVLSIAGTGLLLERKSKTLFLLTIVAAACNIVLNFILIPRFGIIGSTASMVASQLLLHSLVYYHCSPALRSLPPVSVILKAFVAGMLCLSVAFGTEMFHLQSPAWRFVAGALLLLGGYAVPVLVMDGHIRRLLLRRESLGI